MKVSILVPTLNRSSSILPLALNVASTTPAGSYSLVFVLDHADKASREAAQSSPRCRFLLCDGTYPVKINAGLRGSNEELVLPVADDVVFHEGWYEKAIAAFEPYVDVLGTNDLTPITEDGSHATMPIIRRSYIDHVGAASEETGTVFCEGYHHNFVETETCQLAMHRRVWKFAPEVVIEHHHHSWGTREVDDTDRKGNMVNFDADRTFFERRKAKWQRR